MKSAVKKFQEYYNRNFERLGVVNFLPFTQIDEDFEALKTRYLNYPKFTREEKVYFIEPFVSALEKESLAYFPYWGSAYRDSIEKRRMCEARIMTLLQPYKPLFDYYRKKQAGAFFSFSMTYNGRGFYRQDGFLPIYQC